MNVKFNCNYCYRLCCKTGSLEKKLLEILWSKQKGVLNSRPITHVSNDAGDIEALALNHFPSNEEAEVSEREINATKLRRQSQAPVNTSFGSA